VAKIHRKVLHGNIHAEFPKKELNHHISRRGKKRVLKKFKPQKNDRFRLGDPDFSVFFFLCKFD
jgi:hypothetical protein